MAGTCEPVRVLGATLEADATADPKRPLDDLAAATAKYLKEHE